MAKQGWISVKEELPPKDEGVMVLISPYNGDKEELYYVAEAYYGVPDEIEKLQKVKDYLTTEILNQKLEPKKKDDGKYDPSLWRWSIPFHRVTSMEACLMGSSLTHWMPLPPSPFKKG